MPPLIQWVLLMVGLWLVWLGVLGLLENRKNLKRARAAQSWPRIQGVVVSRTIEEGRYNDSKSGNVIHTYRPEIRYQYEVEGRKIEGTRIVFGELLYYQPTEADDFLTAHPEDGTVTIYYDPANPADGVLDPGPSYAKQGLGAEAAMFMFGLVATGAGLWGMLKG